MANPIVGALFFGLFSGTPATGVPVNGIAAHAPIPPCVQCNAADRRGMPTVYDWSNGRTAAIHLRRIERLVLDGGDSVMSVDRLGIAEDALQRLLDYRGA